MTCPICSLEHTDAWPIGWKPADGIPNLQACYPPVVIPRASHADLRDEFMRTWVPRPFGKSQKAAQTRRARAMVARWRAEREARRSQRRAVAA